MGKVWAATGWRSNGLAQWRRVGRFWMLLIYYSGLATSLKIEAGIRVGNDHGAKGIALIAIAP